MNWLNLRVDPGLALQQMEWELGQKLMRAHNAGISCGELGKKIGEKPLEVYRRIANARHYKNSPPIHWDIGARAAMAAAIQMLRYPRHVGWPGT